MEEQIEVKRSRIEWAARRNGRRHMKLKRGGKGPHKQRFVVLATAVRQIQRGTVKQALNGDKNSTRGTAVSSISQPSRSIKMRLPFENI